MAQSEIGFGRTGKLWAHEAYGVSPHMMTINAPLSSKGLTMGALIAPKSIDLSNYDMDSEIFIETNEYLGKISDDVTSIFSEEVLEKGDFFVEVLKREVKENPYVKGIRRVGLLVEIELYYYAREAASGLIEKASKISGFIRVTTHRDRVVIRLLPCPTSPLEELCGEAKECAVLGG